jgi:5-methylcytosine-specific restriction endonuclease McrA
MPYTDALPSKAQIFDHWKDRFRELGIFIDRGEPSCWACGFHYGARYDIKRSDASSIEIFAAWDRIPLQRCHIVPRSLGGEDDVSNLFLMCRECHDLAPNTAIPDIFFRWVRSQSSHRRESDKIQEAIRAFVIDQIERDKLTDVIESAEFKAWLRGKLGLHRPQSNYGSVSSRLTPATIIGLAVHFMKLEHVSHSGGHDPFASGLHD